MVVCSFALVRGDSLSQLRLRSNHCMAATAPPADSFRYPLSLGEHNVTLPNSLGWIRSLYEEAGRIKKQHHSANSSAEAHSDDELYKSWFVHKTKVVPGDVLTIVDSFTYPTPKGMQTLTRARVESVFDRRYLLEMEETSVLKLYSYIELDQLRFAFVAMMDLIDAGKVFGPDGQLTGLAKRDIKKNCGEKAAAALEEAPAAVASAKPAPVQRFLRGVLEDECAARWPHTPVNKSCTFKVEQDPKQPRHKPLFQATVELSLLGNKTFKGEWVGNRRDAESSAADVALRTLHAKKK